MSYNLIEKNVFVGYESLVISCFKNHREQKMAIEDSKQLMVSKTPKFQVDDQI